MLLVNEKPMRQTLSLSGIVKHQARNKVMHTWVKRGVYFHFSCNMRIDEFDKKMKHGYIMTLNEQINNVSFRLAS